MRVCICVLVLSGTITPGFGVSVRLAGATGKDSSGDTEGRGGGARIDDNVRVELFLVHCVMSLNTITGLDRL